MSVTQSITTKKPRKSWMINALNILYASDKEINGATELDSILEQYCSVINGISQPLVIDMIKDTELMMFHKTQKLCKIDQVVFSTTQEMSELFDSSSFEYSETENRNWDVVQEYPDSLLFADGLHCKMYTLTNIHTSLPPGWIYGLYSAADFLRIFINPIDSQKHESVINSHKSIQRTKSSIEEMSQVDDITGIRDLVLNDKTDNLFSVTINAGIIGVNPEELNRKRLRFESVDKKNRNGMYSMKYGQSNFLNGSGQRHLMCKSSMPALVPFHTSELNESGGVLLGENSKTANPVMWDINKRLNRNTVIAATSGSGKTTLAMLIIHAFEKMYPETFVFVIDPESEYKALSENMGFQYIDYSSGTKLGFDIFKMIGDPISAAETLCEALNVPQLNRSITLHAASNLSEIPDRNFFMFYDELQKLEKDITTNHASQYFKILTQPPFSNLMQGEPPKNNKIVLSLKNIGSAAGFVQRLITQMALAYALGKSLSMPKITPKLIMLDEVWMLLQHETLGNYIQNLSRRGRKYNINLMLASQNIEDMTDNPSARNVLVNSDTVMFLRQSEATLKSLVENFTLSSNAATDLMNLKRGQAIIKYGSHMVPVNIMPDEEQLKLFRPK